VIPISTSDFSFSDEDLSFVEIGVQKAFEFWTSVSYGQAELDYAVLPKKNWPILPQVASDLGFPALSNTTDFAVLANDALDLVKVSFDVSPYDNFIFALPAQSLFLTGQSIKLRDVTLSLNGVEQTGIMVGGEYLQLWEITAHELGHSWLRLVDLYKYDTLEKFMGTWEIMGNTFGPGKELTAWSRWLSGWVADDQIRCISSTGNSIHFIEAIENASASPKATVIRISETSVVVIESRRNLGYDTGGPATIVYTVDSEKSAMEGVYRLNATLTSPGQSATIGSVNVTLLDSDELGDLVQVTRN
jgi:M6 family metalloprotease-like protein